MGTESSGNSWNAALAAVLSEHKRDQGKTFEELVTLTGIPLRTIKRVFNDERAMDTDQLIKSAAALGVRPSEVVAEALARLEEGDGA